MIITLYFLEFRSRSKTEDDTFRLRSSAVFIVIFHVLDVRRNSQIFVEYQTIVAFENLGLIKIQIASVEVTVTEADIVIFPLPETAADVYAS